MKINPLQIYEGWKNLLFPPKEIKEAIASIRKQRLDICNICQHNSKFHKTRRPDTHCTKCGCTLLAKTSCLSCECPLTPPKWVPIMTMEQEQEIMPEYEEEATD